MLPHRGSPSLTSETLGRNLPQELLSDAHLHKEGADGTPSIDDKDKPLFRRAIGDDVYPTAARFSRQSILADGQTPKGMPESEVWAVIETFKREFNGAKGIEFKVIASLRDVFGSRADQLGPAKRFFYPASSEDERNTVFLVSSALSGSRDARLTLAHEILAHYGVNLLPADAKCAFLEAIDASRTGPFIRRLAKEVEGTYADKSRLERAEDILALAADHKATQIENPASVSVGGVDRQGLAPRTTTRPPGSVLSIAELLEGAHRYKGTPFSPEVDPNIRFRRPAHGRCQNRPYRQNQDLDVYKVVQRRTWQDRFFRVDHGQAGGN